jgi:hypothetical protein
MLRQRDARQYPCTSSRVCVPHGAEGGFDPFTAYQNLDGDNFYGYLNGAIMPPSTAGEWVSDGAVAVVAPLCRP